MFIKNILLTINNDIVNKFLKMNFYNDFFKYFSLKVYLKLKPLNLS